MIAINASGGPLITEVGAEARAPVSQLIARAFDPLPQTIWIEPDPEVRRVIFPQWFGLFVDRALEGDGSVVDAALLDGQVVGAAIWLRVHPGIPTMSPAYEKHLADITGERYHRFQDFDNTLERHHPAAAPAGGAAPAPVHMHLTMIAVDPQRQSHGVGGALLNHRNQDLDRLGIASYLEASEPRSRKLYLRHGYADLGEPFHLPDGPPMWPMWRDPAAPAGTER